MKTTDWVTCSVIITGGWAALYAGLYEMSVNCFLTIYIIITIKIKQ